MKESESRAQNLSDNEAGDVKENEHPAIRLSEADVIAIVSDDHFNRERFLSLADANETVSEDDLRREIQDALESLAAEAATPEDLKAEKLREMTMYFQSARMKVVELLHKREDDCKDRLDAIAKEVKEQMRIYSRLNGNKPYKLSEELIANEFVAKYYEILDDTSKRENANVVCEYFVNDATLTMDLVGQGISGFAGIPTAARVAAALSVYDVYL